MAKLKKGDTVHVANRLYAVVDDKGRLASTGSDGPAVFFTRQAARDWKVTAERVVRLPDLTCLVV